MPPTKKVKNPSPTAANTLVAARDDPDKAESDDYSNDPELGRRRRIPVMTLDKLRVEAFEAVRPANGGEVCPIAAANYLIDSINQKRQT